MVPPKPDNALRWKSPLSDRMAEGMSDGMEVDIVDLVQREINKIELHNLKDDIADMTRRINILQRKVKQRAETDKELTE